jgi:hypothetical protein
VAVVSSAVVTIEAKNLVVNMVLSLFPGADQPAPERIASSVPVYLLCKINDLENCVLV